ncbi:MAG: hypothetical protein JWM37_803 [Candidatus Saccharibacteria bacterium]|nr:hypothetical protein [Candidatus Saccharibacteria bacterium]
MDTATQILVIIVSVLLSMVLIVTIVVLVLIAKLVKEIKRVVAKAENIAESASHLTEIVRDASGPLAIVKVVRNIIKAVKK